MYLYLSFNLLHRTLMYKNSTVQYLLVSFMFCIQLWITNLTFKLTIIYIIPSSQSQWNNKWHESVQWKKRGAVVRQTWPLCPTERVCTRGRRGAEQRMQEEAYQCSPSCLLLYVQCSFIPVGLPPITELCSCMQGLPAAWGLHMAMSTARPSCMSQQSEL